MAELHKLVATLKSALEAGAPMPAQEHPVHAAVPLATDAFRAELVARFARELEAVGGRFLGVFTPAKATDRIVALAKETNPRLVAIGDGVATSDADTIAGALDAAGFALMRTAPTTDSEARAAIRDRMARADIGIAEADYAIASTGTLAVLSMPTRPSSLTLLPPASVIFVRIDRIVPDLAAALDAFGSDTLAANRMTLITGPSRTADIEKRIVLGVHGPKSLDVLVIWPHDD
ncbi:MAG TPA: lactate utilization protein [Candidatus Binataceae bacterium]|nr:lactate utilization protein [Candidatus Binataceae bacterium]